MTGGKVKNGKKDVKKPDEKGRNALKGREPSLDYGNTYTSSESTIDKAMRSHGKKDPTFQEQLFGGYMGSYETAEGRLLHHTVGIESHEQLLKALLDSRPDEHAIKPEQTIGVGGYELTYIGCVNEPKEAIIDIKNKKTGKSMRTTIFPGVETPILFPGDSGRTEDDRRMLVTVSKCNETGASLTIKEG